MKYIPTKNSTSYSKTAYNILTFKMNYNNGLATGIEITVSTENYDVLTINDTRETTKSTFLPTESWQPATKQYVDNKMAGAGIVYYRKSIGGQSANTSYTITHNMNTSDVIIQCRDASTHKEVIVDNQIVNANSIKVTPNTAVSADGMIVYILALK